MKKNQKIFIIVLGIIFFCILTVVLLNIFMPKPEIKPDDIEVSQRNVQEQELPPVTSSNETAKEYVNIYFIGKNENNQEVYKAVRRLYKPEIDGSKIKFAIYALINGPKPEEQQKGVYTEIPNEAQVINVAEKSDMVIVNLNSSFVYTIKKKNNITCYI